MPRIIFTPLLILGLFLCSGGLYANDFPTLDRVSYVLDCMKEDAKEKHAESLSREALYQCVCRIDAIAKQIPFAEYDEAHVFEVYAAMPGERGGVIRDNKRAKRLQKKLVAIREEVLRSCPSIRHIAAPRASTAPGGQE